MLAAPGPGEMSWDNSSVGGGRGHSGLLEACCPTPVPPERPSYVTDEAHAQQVARVPTLSTRSLRSYARRGLLRPVYYGGSSRAWGYHADSVRAFIENAKR